MNQRLTGSGLQHQVAIRVERNSGITGDELADRFADEVGSPTLDQPAFIVIAQ